MSDEKLQEATEFMKARPKIDESQVEEMRNKLTKKMDKWADKIQVSMAFTPKVNRREGERWTDENGKSWEMKDNIARSVGVRDAARMPIWCPSCTHPMNKKIDDKFYWTRGWCFDCNVEKDGEMIARRDGSWEKYCTQIMRANEVSFLKDKIMEHMEYMRTFRAPQIHFESGGWEEIATREDFAPLFEKLEADIEFCLARLDVIKKEQEEEENRKKEDSVS
jgi:hypothetical protein